MATPSPGKCNLCFCLLPPKYTRRAVRAGRAYYRPTCAACVLIWARIAESHKADRQAPIPDAARAERDTRIAEYRKRLKAGRPITPDRRPRPIYA